MYRITAPTLHNCSIDLPRSKSISNRVLIINALAQSVYPPEGLAHCDDTSVMLEALDTDNTTINIDNAGTAMRFLTAYFATQPGSRILTGSPRMLQRPIAPLVDALRDIGADIAYIGLAGFPPLRINGNTLKGGAVTIPAHISSQFISAILLIAPYTTQGVQLTLQGHITSRPYIDMTLALMQQYGINAIQEDNTISIPPSSYRYTTPHIERDWSAAAFWYLITLLSQQSFDLNQLTTTGIQGDAIAARYFEKLGVTTQPGTNGTRIAPCQHSITQQEWLLNLSHCPDLAQPLIVGCLLKGQHFCFEGLHNLRIKETDRITDTIQQARKLGYILTQPHNGSIRWSGEMCDITHPIVIDTCNDHRIAMTFAPAAITHKEICILHPSVVEKSYPEFWQHLAMAGFNITDNNGKEIKL